MTEELHPAVHLATLERAHRQAVQDVMQSDMGDIARVSLVLAMEAEHLGRMESFRVAGQSIPTPQRGGRPR